MDNQSPKLKNPIETYFNIISRYHIFLFTLLFLSKIPMFWHILSLIFLSPPMDYICKDSGEKNSCPCKNPEWNRSVFTETLQTKFDIYCEKTWLISFSQSMLFVGTLFGCLLFGFLSDKYGRLSMFCLSSFTLSACGCLVSVMPTITSFIMMRCLEGIGVGGAVINSYVLCVEYCSTKNREVITALYHLPLNVGHMALSGVSYLFRHCDDFQLAISVPMFLFVPMYWIVYESPKWLMDKDAEKAATVMEKIVKFNKQPNNTIRNEIVEFLNEKEKSTEHKITFFQIFKHKQLTRSFLLMSLIYFVCGMGYYGVSQYIGMMSGDIHVNVAISGALLIPGTLSAVILLKLLSRKKFLTGTLLISGTLIIIVVCLPSDLVWTRIVIACICNCFFFMAFMIVFLYGVELFPTSVRTSVLGVLSLESRIGQIIAPFINAMSGLIAGIVFGVMAIIAGLACYPLPETKDSELPSSLEDSNKLPQRLSLEHRNPNIRIRDQN